MADAITTLRILLAILALAIIKLNPLANTIALLLIATCMLLDALDGFVARRLKTSSFTGSVYDILADRIVENLFFIYYATLGLFSVWLAIIILIRGLTADAVRTVFATEGKTAFGAKTLHTKQWTRFFTGSRLSRGTYNTFKMLTFLSYGTLVMANHSLFKYIPHERMELIAQFCLTVTILVALIRTIPVIYEVKQLNW